MPDKKRKGKKAQEEQNQQDVQNLQDILPVEEPLTESQPKSETPVEGKRPIEVELNIGTGNQDLTTGARTLQGKTVFDETLNVKIDINQSKTFNNVRTTTTTTRTLYNNEEYKVGLNNIAQDMQNTIVKADNNIQKLNNHSNELQKAQEQIQAGLTQPEQAYQNTTQEIAKLNAVNNDLLSQKSKYQEQQNDLINQRAKLDGQIEVHKQKINNINTNYPEANTALSALSNQSNNLNGEITDLQNDNATLQAQITEAKVQRGILRQQLDDSHEQYNVKQQIFGDALDRYNDANNARSELQNQSNSLYNEIRVLKNNNDNLQIQIAQYQRYQKDLIRQIGNLDGQIEVLTQDLDKPGNKDNIAELTAQRNALQETLSEINFSITDTKWGYDENLASIQKLTNQRAIIDSKKEELVAQIPELKKDVETKQNELHEFVIYQNELSAELRDVTSGITDMTENYNHNLSTLQNLTTQKVTLDGKIKELNTQLAELSKDREANKDKIAELQGQKKALDEEITAVGQAINHLTSDYNNNFSTLQNLTASKNNISNAIQSLKNEIAKLSKDKEANQAKIDELKNQIETYEQALEIINEQIEAENALEDSVEVAEETKDEVIIIDKTSNIPTKITVPAQKHLDLASLQAFYNENGKDAAKTYQHLLDHINQYKDDPEVLQHTISALLGDMNEHYDDSKNHVAPGKNIVDQFDKILNLGENEQLKGLMCESIHFTVMKALNDCGIEAVTLGGGTRSGGTDNHATLLYKNSKGEYVSCNYGDYKVVQADNILDATKEVYKNVTDDILMTNGTITIQDENNMYQTYALENVAAWGKVIADKGVLSKPGATPIADSDNISGTFNDNGGNQFINIGATIGSQDQSRMFNFEVQGLKTGESDIAQSSESAGIKQQFVYTKNLGDKTKLFVDNTAILTNTTLHNTDNSANTNHIRPELSQAELYRAAQDAIQYTTEDDGIQDVNNSPEVVYEKSNIHNQKRPDYRFAMPDGTVYEAKGYNVTTTESEVQTLETKSIETRTNVEDIEVVPVNDTVPTAPAVTKTDLTTMADIAKVGVQTELVDSGNARVEGVSQVTLKADATFGNGLGGQASVTLEQGVTAQMKPTENLTLSADASAGLVLTGAEHNNYEGIFLQPGFKGTAGVGLDWKPNEHLDLSTSLSGGILTDAASTQTAYTVGAQVNYKPGQDAPTIFAGGQYTAQHEQLHLGNFDEAIRDNNNLRIQLGTKFKNNSQLSIDYNKYSDALHKNQNSNSWMMTYKRTFGGK